jgi:isoamylase
MQPVSYKTSPGSPRPFGVNKKEDGCNFAVVAPHARKVSLRFHKSSSESQPEGEIALDPQINRTGSVWHIFIHELKAPSFYEYIVDNQSVLDPYSKMVATTNVWEANREGYHPLGGIVDETFDWEDDKPPNIPQEDLIIYEMHLHGFTKHSSSQVKNPGSYKGVIEKIPYLKDLGVNAVELLPIYEFNECEYGRINPITKKPLCNYWGYSTANFFSPMQRYASTNMPEAPIKEFKQLVKELHKNGIEVILDVVYNHTAEGNEKGPSFSFKCLGHSIYYTLDSEGHYTNFSGCGNTFNCNHPIVREFIQDSLRYWVTEMHVDGFRFDLASILARGPRGQPMMHPPLVEAISHDPVLSHVKLIAEPWDAGGLYQVGSFHHMGDGRWSEWNGRYRDALRRFIRGVGTKQEFATNICGSQDLYHRYTPSLSINFITAHDGFTLMDLVSYTRKHNISNGEDNRDGTNDNESWNCGIEGPTLVKPVAALRARQIRNFHLALMISRGVPMLLMGDEYHHTRHGNNNTWCQENELNWFLWDQLEKYKDFHRFYRGLIHFRKNNHLLHQNAFITVEDTDWHGKELHKPNWGLTDRFLALTLKNSVNGSDLYIAFNAGPDEVTIALPTNQDDVKWHWIVNTSKPSPEDFYTEEESPLVAETQYTMLPYSSLMLKAMKKS